MADLTSSNWLSFHLHCAPDAWDELLVKGVIPFIQKEENIMQFFYIRYMEDGPHIRLRLRVEGQGEGIRESIKEYFLNYFKNNISILENINPIWKNNNAIYEIPYQAETARFGGAYGMKICEQFFDASSVLALTVLENGLGEAYEQKLGKAVQFHICFALCAGLDNAEASLFFNYIYETWVSTIEGSLEEVKAFVEFFEAQASEQKKALAPFIKNLRNAIQNNYEINPPFFQDWMLACQELDKEIRAIQKEGKLKDSSLPMPRPEGMEASLHQRLNIYQHLLHLLNNRLGIANRDEAFLAYILKKSFE